MLRHIAPALCVTLLAASAASAQIAPGRPDSTFRLARLFAPGMVLQRDTPIPVWGRAAPDATVTVEWRAATRNATATRDGRWQLLLPPTPAGGPYPMSVRSGARAIELQDILVGDVWVAGGQSNMELTVARARDAAGEIARAHDTGIRQFKVPIAWSDTIASELAGGSWASADSAHVGAFTAVGYFFARELRDSVRVPIGLVNATWGGSAIETWMSQQANGLSDSALAIGRRAESARLDSIRAALRARLGNLPDRDPGLRDGVALWAEPALDDAAWSAITTSSYWETQGYPGMDGVGWYRVPFILGEQQVRGDLALSLDAVDDDDITWVNGMEVGRTAGYAVPRRYRVPAAALHTGRNVLTVRVSDGGGGGGIAGAVALRSGDGTTIPFAGPWKFRVGQVSFAPDGQRINKLPAVSYNAMIAPLLPFAIKGVIWYQGESNANDVAQATAYRAQFDRLIRSWRHDWRASDERFPFLWVQLPNFGRTDTVPPAPAAAAWAAQRESMDAALALPNTGRAVTIDVGEADDIHPRDKQDVGDRLARVALAVAYGRPVVASGPTYRSHEVRGGRVLVSFDHVASGLLARGGDGITVGAFDIAGPDRRFVRASARIVGGGVEVWSDAVGDPRAIRYAWANNPPGPLLYNRDGLPAAPFRTAWW